MRDHNYRESGRHRAAERIRLKLCGTGYEMANWWMSHIGGGIVRWATAAIVTAVCAVVGFSPPQWLEGIWRSPPEWLTDIRFRVVVVVLGVIVVASTILWRKRKPASEDPSVTYETHHHTTNIYYQSATPSPTGFITFSPGNNFGLSNS